MKKFQTGKVLLSQQVYERVEEDSNFSQYVLLALLKYKRCDWGDCCVEDKQANDSAIVNGDRIFATYIYPMDNTKIWIITEADRSITTVLFPDEY